MARHTWHKALNRMRDSNYLLLSLEACAVLARLEDQMADEPLSGNLSTLALYLGVDQKKYRLKTHLDTLISEGYIKGASEDRGKKGLWYTLDLPDDHPERVEKDPAKDQERSEKGLRKGEQRSKKGSGKGGETGVDKSAKNAGPGDSSLKEKEILPSEGEEKPEGEAERENARAADTLPPPDANGHHPDAARLCNLLADLIHANGLERPAVRLDWLDEMTALLVTDMRAPIDVEGAIRFAQGDSWWRGVILHPKNLRRNWLKLLAQAQRPRASPGRTKAQERFDAEMAEFEREHGLT